MGVPGAEQTRRHWLVSDENMKHELEEAEERSATLRCRQATAGIKTCKRGVYDYY